MQLGLVGGGGGEKTTRLNPLYFCSVQFLIKNASSMNAPQGKKRS